jgi:UDP-GlcNAc:undecaprenyl-phosphate/decaprenyl-phosphate GlcNAc-1-phosphate transferase
MNARVPLSNRQSEPTTVISAITAFSIALATVVAVTPFVRRLALDMGAVDRPSERRVHGRVIPRLGGIAIIIAFFVPLLALFGLETGVAKQYFSEPMRIVGLVAGALIVSGLGVFDDIRGVRAWTKLWVQFAAAAVAYACGYRIDAVAVPFIGHLEMGVFALPITALWIVAIINAVNLIDGLDGLAGGVAFFACVTNFVVAAINNDGLVMLLSASMGGAVLGFLLYNFNPASIFMGDSGSLFLGYVLATTSILGSSVKSSCPSWTRCSR